MGDSCERPPGVETHEGVMALAGVLGSFGAVAFGFIGLACAASGPVGVECIPIVLGFALTGGTLGFGVVGLTALLCGAKLGRCFTYPFMIYFASLVGPVVLLSLNWAEFRDYEPFFLEGWVVCLVLGVVLARFLSRAIRGYLLFARIFAAIGTILMILWGMSYLRGPREVSICSKFTTDPGEVILFFIVLSWVGLIGGSLGAVVGAVFDSSGSVTMVLSAKTEV